MHEWKFSKEWVSNVIDMQRIKMICALLEILSRS
jgi:hypothetical protein